MEEAGHLRNADDCMNPLFHFSASIDVNGSFSPTNRKCLNIRAYFFVYVCVRVCVYVCVCTCLCLLVPVCRHGNDARETFDVT